jgi:hypothetical protein
MVGNSIQFILTVDEKLKMFHEFHVKKKHTFLLEF